MTSKWMSPLDAAWLLMESPDTPMHIGALTIFSQPRNASTTYMSDIAARLRSCLEARPPWNLRLAGGARGGFVRRLEAIDELDLDYHFRHTALPSPGGERQLGILVSGLHSQALDHGRPLWEFHLIEGLEANRFAFYLKVHHALVRDINLVPLLLAMLSENPRRRNMAPPWTLPLPDDSGDGDDRDASVYSGLDSFPGPVEAISSLARTTGGVMRAAVAQARSGALVPNGAPRSTLNRAINAQRRFATQQYTLGRIERLATATDSTVNEILSYLCSSSLRRFFKEYNALPDESLVAAVPVGLRDRSRHQSSSAMTAIRVSLGTDIGDPLRRLEVIKESIQGVRDDIQSLPEAAVTAYALTRSAPLIVSQMPTLGRLVPPLFNLGVSHTPTLDRALYFDGARLDALYPMAQLMQFSALSIDCVSYAGTLNFGLTGARDTLPHLQRLAVYIGQAVTDLEEILQLEVTT